jgi:hypothetical protein
MFGEFAAKDVILKRVHESLARSGSVGVDDAPQIQVCRAPMLVYQGFASDN